jgi:hypothetical protein
MTDKTVTTEAPAFNESVQTEGVRARRAFMLKQFLPSADWINVNIVAKGKGTQVVVGRVYGTCTGYENKRNALPDGSFSDSIALVGVFQQESAITGELSESSTVYLPMAYAGKVRSIFDAASPLKDDGTLGPSAVRLIELDCDIGLEATGKTIPYEWVVIAYLEGKEMERMKALRSVRKPGMTAAATLAQKAEQPAPALNAPAEGGGDNTTEADTQASKPAKK